MKSAIVKIKGKHFRYDFGKGIVEWVVKAKAEDYKDNERWMADFGENLWDIDEDGWIGVESIGLTEENWKNKDARLEYVGGWADELDEESSILADQFLAWG